MIYAKELQKYKEAELHSKFKLDVGTINKLVERKVIFKEEIGIFCFKFVGVLIVNDEVIFCLPKYVRKSDKFLLTKQILALFKEYSRREKLDKDDLNTIGNIESMIVYNMLSTINFLMSDYFENGLYSNEKCIHVLNGDDEINWIKTLNEIDPVISAGEPVYLEYYSDSTQNDEENYFRKLHRYALDLCSEKLEKLGLTDFLGIGKVFFNEDGEVLGTPEAMVSRINAELNVQFVNRKQMVLKAMAAFLLNENMNADNTTISFYGTRSFHMVWEKTCGYVIGNKYENVKKFIARPNWTTATGKVYRADTLIPDIISMNNRVFAISDAKYYNIVLQDDKLLSGNPGIEDVTKQYLYQLAFVEYIKIKKFEVVMNMLLFPTEEDEMHKIGDVSIKFLKKINLEDISLYKVPAHKIFELYVNCREIDLNRFLNCDI